MKKLLSIILLSAVIFTATACSYTEPPEYQPGNNGGDMFHGMGSIMKTEDGYYYMGDYIKNETKIATNVPLFYDNKTGESAILCSRPECLHDGNEFCAATARERWTICFKECLNLYNGYIYKIYDCMITDRDGYTGKSEVRIRRLDLKGNECSDLGCIIEFITEDNANMPNVTDLIFHRGKLFFTMQGFNEGQLFEYDLNNCTRKQIIIPPNEEGGRKSTPIGLIAQGDYLYYAVRYVKYSSNSQMTDNNITYDKTVLRRYNMITEETETISAMPDIYSSFTVNDGTIYYTTVDRVNNTFSFYSYNIEEDKTTAIAENVQQNYMNGKHLSGSARVITDGEYMYISIGSQSSHDKESPTYEHDFYIYSFEGEQLLHGLKNLPANIPDWNYEYKVLDGEIYMNFKDSSKSNNDTSDTITGVYMISTEELINGSSEWTKLYKAN